jgi:hypothetical protein
LVDASFAEREKIRDECRQAEIKRKKFLKDKKVIETRHKWLVDTAKDRFVVSKSHRLKRKASLVDLEKSKLESFHEVHLSKKQCIQVEKDGEPESESDRFIKVESVKMGHIKTEPVAENKQHWRTEPTEIQGESSRHSQKPCGTTGSSDESHMEIVDKSEEQLRSSSPDSAQELVQTIEHATNLGLSKNSDCTTPPRSRFQSYKPENGPNDSEIIQHHLSNQPQDGILSANRTITPLRYQPLNNSFHGHFRDQYKRNSSCDRDTDQEFTTSSSCISTGVERYSLSFTPSLSVTEEGQDLQKGADYIVQANANEQHLNYTTVARQEEAVAGRGVLKPHNFKVSDEAKGYQYWGSYPDYGINTTSCESKVSDEKFHQRLEELSASGTSKSELIHLSSGNDRSDSHEPGTLVLAQLTERQQESRLLETDFETKRKFSNDGYSNAVSDRYATEKVEKLKSIKFAERGLSPEELTKKDIMGSPIPINRSSKDESTSNIAIVDLREAPRQSLDSLDLKNDSINAWNYDDQNQRNTIRQPPSLETGYEMPSTNTRLVHLSNNATETTTCDDLRNGQPIGEKLPQNCAAMKCIKEFGQGDISLETAIEAEHPVKLAGRQEKTGCQTLAQSDGSFKDTLQEVAHVCHASGCEELTGISEHSLSFGNLEMRSECTEASLDRPTFMQHTEEDDSNQTPPESSRAVKDAGMLDAAPLQVPCVADETYDQKLTSDEDPRPQFKGNLAEHRDFTPGIQVAPREGDYLDAYHGSCGKGTTNGNSKDEGNLSSKCTGASSSATPKHLMTVKEDPKESASQIIDQTVRDHAFAKTIRSRGTPPEKELTVVQIDKAIVNMKEELISISLFGEFTSTPENLAFCQKCHIERPGSDVQHPCQTCKDAERTFLQQINGSKDNNSKDTLMLTKEVDNKTLICQTVAPKGLTDDSTNLGQNIDGVKLVTGEAESLGSDAKHSINSKMLKISGFRKCDPTVPQSRKVSAVRPVPQIAKGPRGNPLCTGCRQTFFARKDVQTHINEKCNRLRKVEIWKSKRSIAQLGFEKDTTSVRASIVKMDSNSNKANHPEEFIVQNATTSKSHL